MRIELTENLLKCLKFITDTFYEINIRTDSTGIHLAETIEGSFFGLIFDYRISGLKDSLFRIDCMKLNKILRIVKNEKAFLEFDTTDKIMIYIEGKEYKREFSLTKFVPNPEDTQIIKAKKYNYEIDFPMLLSRLNDITSEAEIFNTSVWLIATKGRDKLVLDAEEEVGRGYKATIELPEKSKSDAKARYRIEFLKKITSIPSSNVTIKFGDNFPMLCYIEEDDFELNFVIAPLVDA